MRDVVRALVGEKERKRRVDQHAHVVKRARPCGAQEGFQFRKRHLDRIEVGTVGRQKPEARAGLFDRGPHLGLLMHGEVIEHDHLARPQRGHQDLLDIRAEGRSIDRAIKHRRRGQRRGPQPRHNRVRLPIAARRVIGGARAEYVAAIVTSGLRSTTTAYYVPANTALDVFREISLRTSSSRSPSATILFSRWFRAPAAAGASRSAPGCRSACAARKSFRHSRRASSRRQVPSKTNLFCQRATNGWRCARGAASE